MPTSLSTQQTGGGARLKRLTRPALSNIAGAGIGLRPQHIHQVLTKKPRVSWFEVHICNYLNGGINLELLRKIAEHYLLSFHSVSMNLGGCNALDYEYLNALKQLKNELKPSLISDHLCFTAFQGEHFHDLLPSPLTEHSLLHIAERVNIIQDTLQQQLLVENVSLYYQNKSNEFTEAEFLNALCERTGCAVLLDLNNLYVNEHNFSITSERFINTLDVRNVKEIHLAGHTARDTFLIDSHACDISSEVWSLYEEFIRRSPNIPTLIEWDSNLPPFSKLVSLAEKANSSSKRAQIERLKINEAHVHE